MAARKKDVAEICTPHPATTLTQSHSPLTHNILTKWWLGLRCSTASYLTSPSAIHVNKEEDGCGLAELRNRAVSNSTLAIRIGAGARTGQWLLRCVLASHCGRTISLIGSFCSDSPGALDALAKTAPNEQGRASQAQRTVLGSRDLLLCILRNLDLETLLLDVSAVHHGFQSVCKSHALLTNLIQDELQRRMPGAGVLVKAQVVRRRLAARKTVVIDRGRRARYVHRMMLLRSMVSNPCKSRQCPAR
jgi:hypothetical protein